MNPNKKVRHLQSLLYTSGVGTILFSLWSVIRSIIVLFDEFPQIYEEITLDKKMLMIGGIVIFIIFFGMIALYLYIGRQAIAVSLGKRKGNAYLILAALIVVISCILYVNDIRRVSMPESFQLRNMIFFVIDFTSNIILGEVVVFSVWLKKLRGKACR